MKNNTPPRQTTKTINTGIYATEAEYYFLFNPQNENEPFIILVCDLRQYIQDYRIELKFKKTTAKQWHNKVYKTFGYIFPVEILQTMNKNIMCLLDDEQMKTD